MGSRARRSAFSIIELLVVIGIIALLLALVFPAIQRVRETMNVAACKSNLRQIGLALVAFHTDRGALPPGGVSGGFDKLHVPLTTPSLTHGWGTFLLPHLDEAPLYAQYKLDKDFRDPMNHDVVAKQLKVFTCPTADPGNRYDTFTSGGFANWQTAATDFAVFNGVSGVLATRLGIVFPPSVPAGNSGVMAVVGSDPNFRLNRMIRMGEIDDGASNTIVIAESAGRPDLYKQRVQYAASSGFRVRGAGWADRQNEHFISGSLPDGTINAADPNANCAVNCTNNGEIYAFHNLGANALFADGHVAFLRSNVSLRLLVSLITRNLKEPVSAADLE